MKNLDIFASEFHFRFFGDRSIHTIQSMILSLLSLIFIFAIFLKFLIEFIKKKNPYSIQTTIANANFDWINLSNEDYFFAFRFEDDDAPPVDLSDVFFITPMYYDYTYQGENKHRELELKRCEVVNETAYGEDLSNFY